MDVFYASIIGSQPSTDPFAYTPPFIEGYLLLLAILLAVSLVRRVGRTVRTGLRAAAAGGLLVLGVIAAFSIGLPLVLAGCLAAAGTVTTLRPPHVTGAAVAGMAGGFIAVAVLIAGFEVTERLVVCPATGTMTGGGAGFVTGPFHYECIDGVLTFHSGSCSGAATGC